MGIRAEIYMLDQGKNFFFFLWWVVKTPLPDSLISHLNCKYKRVRCTRSEKDLGGISHGRIVSILWVPPQHREKAKESLLTLSQETKTLKDSLEKLLHIPCSVRSHGRWYESFLRNRVTRWLRWPVSDKVEDCGLSVTLLPEIFSANSMWEFSANQMRIYNRESIWDFLRSYS
jgi:hypothetical protein